MSGHSKWHNIRVKKTAMDARRGKIYTRHARLIEMATRAGSNGDPDTNPSLRTAIENAKADNVPNANIERAIKKGLGESKGEQMAEIVYAAYGPGGAAFLIECLTDNRNRTLANVKSLISHSGGNFAESGSVMWMFDRKGVVVGKKSGLTPAGMEEIELELIDFGAQDLELTGDVLSVTTEATSWPSIRDFLKRQEFEIESAGLKFVPTQKTAIADAATAKKVMTFMETIEEDDDVTEVHTNADISAEVVGQLS